MLILCLSMSKVISQTDGQADKNIKSIVRNLIIGIVLQLKNPNYYKLLNLLNITKVSLFIL
jgi:hypothetical protein